MKATNKNEAQLAKGAMSNGITELRNLEAAGMPSEQAECVVNSVQTLIKASHETIAADLDKRDLVDKETFRLESEAISRRVVGEEIDKRDLVSKETLKAVTAESRLEAKEDIAALNSKISELQVALNDKTSELRVELHRSLRNNMIATVVLFSAVMATFLGLAGFFG